MYDSCGMSTGNSLRAQMLGFDYMFLIALDDGQYVFKAFSLQFQSYMSEVKYIFAYKL